MITISMQHATGTRAIVALSSNRVRAVNCTQLVSRHRNFSMCTVRANLRDALVVEEPTSPILPEHYTIVGSLRHVLPYYFDFKLHVKRRMSGQTIVDLFCSEFPAKSRYDTLLPHILRHDFACTYFVSKILKISRVHRYRARYDVR